MSNLRSQIVTSSWGGTSHLPNAFTEQQGVAMLSSILNSDKAIEISIQIIRVFTKIRKMLLDNTELSMTINDLKRKTENDSKNIEVVFNYLDQLAEKEKSVKPRERIGFKSDEI